MADLLIRDLDATTHDLLRRRAEQAGRSLHAEIKRILEAAAHVPDVEAAHVLADQIAARLSGRSHPDSAELVREVRDRWAKPLIAMSSNRQSLPSIGPTR